MVKQQKTARQVTVLVRYSIKQDVPSKGLHKGDVVLYVENDKGKRYYTTLRRNKAHTCTCPANATFSKKCYHIDMMVKQQNDRYAVAKAAKHVIVMPAQPVDNSEHLSTKGHLNVSRGFSLLKVS